MKNQSWNWQDLRRFIAAQISSVSNPVFLATAKPGGRNLKLMSFEKPAKQDIKSLERNLRESGLDIRVQHSYVSPSKFASMETIEGIHALAGNDTIIFDPSEIFLRSRAVVDLIAALRAMAGDYLTSIHADTWQRVLYCKVKPGTSKVIIQEIEARTKHIIEAWLTRVPNNFKLAVRYCEQLPSHAKVSTVDARSLPKFSYEGARLKFKRKLSVGLLASAVALLPGTALADVAIRPGNITVVHKTSYSVDVNAPPAVDEPNFTLQGLTSFAKDDTWYGTGAKAALPLGNLFGIQIEGGFGEQDYYGVGGHLFWRDPTVGLLGVIGSFETLSQVNMTRVGLEAEKYLGDLTIASKLSSQIGDVKSGTAASADVSFYATPDFVLKAGGEYNPEQSGLHAGAEYRPAFNQIPGLSLFADSQFDEDGFDRVMVGMKLYFGSQGTTLIDRDRKSDPSDLLFNLRTLESAQAY